MFSDDVSEEWFDDLQSGYKQSKADRHTKEAKMSQSSNVNKSCPDKMPQAVYFTLEGGV